MSSILVRHLNFLDNNKGGPRSAFAFNYLTLILILVVFVGGGVGYYQYQKHQIEKLRLEIEVANNEVAQMRQAEQSKGAALTAEALQNLLGNPIIWSGVVKEILGKIPKTVKLIQIAGTIKDQRTLLLKGYSPFLSPIFLLKNDISAVKGCKDAKIVSVEHSPQNVYGKQYTFHMECTLT